MKSFNKVFDILEIFLDIDNSEVRLSEIVKLSGLNISTVRRIVSMLVERGYLRQKEKWGKYSLGSKFLSFSGVINKRTNVRDTAMPYLLKLNKACRETVILATWDGKEAFYREIIDSVNAIRILPDKNIKIPLYCTSVGKIILANMSKVELTQYLDNTELIPHSDNTITDVNLLKNQLNMALKENIAYDDQEFAYDSRSVASGIRDSQSNIIACICIFGPASRLTRTKMKETESLVINCAMEISNEIGYSNRDIIHLSENTVRDK
jgi:DNA-binding IclR family transcriptional regulator